MTNTYTPGDSVHWITGHTMATVLRVKDGGELVIRPAGDIACVTTRACFVIPATGFAR